MEVQRLVCYRFGAVVAATDGVTDERRQAPD